MTKESHYESVMYLLNLLRNIICVRILSAFRTPMATILIDEAAAASSGSTNDLYDAAQLYLGSHCLAAASLCTSTSRASQAFPVERSAGHKHNSYNVFGSFPRQHRDFVHDTYIPDVIDEATRMRLKSWVRKLYTNYAAAPSDDHIRLWTFHTFSHPFTFDTPTACIDHSWKREYQLHGPPGTGKTNLVATILNLLEFGVYALELTMVPTNSHLRRLLISTMPKSIVGIEDIDCSLDLSDQKKSSGGRRGQHAAGELSPPVTAAMPVYLHQVVDGFMAEAKGLLSTDVCIMLASIGGVFMGCDGASASAALRRLVGKLRGRKDMSIAEMVQSGALTGEKME
ncbi:hypothetical protein VPH35_078464 [Triticum aestivum]